MSSEKEEKFKCSFCDKDQDQVKKLIAGPDDVYICDECIVLCHDILKSSAVKTDGDGKSVSDIPSPSEIHKFLDQYVIGQTHAKMVLAVAIHNHYKRLENPVIDDVEIDKANILLTGPSGSGKTYLAQTAARMLNVPFAIADATTFSEAGYVGDDVESVIYKLVQNAGGDVSKAERGIVFIDEIDKIGRRGENASITRDVGGEGVQQALLKMVEGTECRVPPNGGRKNPQQEMLVVDTKNILFIASGAFVGLDDIVAKRIGLKTSIGFKGNVDATRSDADTASLLEKLEPTDLVKFGMIPEFVGRFPVTTSVQELSEEQLVDILTTPKNALVRQYSKMFNLEKVEIEFTPSALTEVAKQCKSRKTGARGLRSVLEHCLLPVQYHLPDYFKQGITKIIVGDDVITGKAEPIKVVEPVEHPVHG